MYRRAFVSMVVLVVVIAAWGGDVIQGVDARDAAGTWMTVPGAKPPAISRRIGGMAALSSSDVWAVGWSNITPMPGVARVQPLIEHWDGTTWSALPAPTPADRDAYLFAVAAVFPNDIWAVGEVVPDTDSTGNAEQPLTLHYDGSAWAQIPVPIVSGQSSHALLATVTAIGPNDVWAAGRDGAGGLVYHWNGAMWSSVGVPSASGVVRDQLDWNGINAVSAHDIWLVGERRLGQFGTNGTQPVAAHWDGIAWTLVNTPLPPGIQNRLESVTAHAPNDIWAVGSVGTPPDWPMAAADMRVTPFVLHWDGAQWSAVAVPLPDMGATVTDLTAVVALRADDVWVSGTFGVKVAQGDIVTDSAQTFFLHWDGTVWTTVAAPAAASVSGFPFETPTALVAASPTELWCGGQFQQGSASFLHYLG